MPRPSPRRSLPTFIKPMLASSGTAFDDDAYLFEIKWNGIRMLAFLETPCYRLMNRHGIDTTSRYPEFAFLAELPPGTVLDGEVVVFRDGQPDLSRTLHLVLRTQPLTQPTAHVLIDRSIGRADRRRDAL